jgi:Flp pilus assembly protein TadD
VSADSTERDRNRLAFLAQAIVNHPKDTEVLVSNVEAHGVSRSLERALNTIRRIATTDRKELETQAELLYQSSDEIEKMVGLAILAGISN